MKFIDLNKSDRFTPDKPHRELLYDSPNLRVLTFNFEPGQELPVHSHSADSDVALIMLDDPARHAPPGAKSVVMERELPCRPCYSPHCLKDFKCMRGIKPSEVMEEVRRLIP